jgi:DNA-binding LytR/AlgR family response regulator
MSQQKIRCIVVDDEHLAIKLLENFVLKFPGLELVAKCKDPIEAKAVLDEQEVDLMFLDIQMPGLTGIEFLQTLKHKPLVIFTTAYSDYALQGYQLDVVDYLLKPFAFDRFAQATNKAIERLSLLRNQGAPATQVPIEAAPENERDYMMVKADHKLYKVNFRDIQYIEGLKAYVSFYLPDRRIVALESLKRLEELLPDDQFMRVHKSFIVAFNLISSIDGNQVELNGKKIPIGKSYKEEVLRRFKIG